MFTKLRIPKGHFFGDCVGISSKSAIVADTDGDHAVAYVFELK